MTVGGICRLSPVAAGPTLNTTTENGPASIVTDPSEWTVPDGIHGSPLGDRFGSTRTTDREYSRVTAERDARFN